MLNFCSLYSGSSGNSLFVQTANSKILIDCGVSSKKVEEALNSIEVAPSSIDAVLVTHEHIDHVKGLATFSSKFNIPVFSTAETFENMEKITSKISENNLNYFKINEKFCIGDLEILPFAIPHDAANPCGFNIFKDKKKISIATDLGHVSADILKSLRNSSLVMLESNYDANVLQYSSYPYLLKQRICGPKGHLENCATGQTIAHLIGSGLEQALLIHLSKENNFPELALKTVTEELQRQKFSASSVSLNVAPRSSPSKLFEII